MNFKSHHYCAPDCPTHCFVCGRWHGFGHDPFKHQMYEIEKCAHERRQGERDEH